MNLLQKTLIASIALAFSLQAVAAEARQKRCTQSAGSVSQPVDAPRGVYLYQAQIKLKPRKSETPGLLLIPPSVAAKRARRAYGGKILSVSLQGTVYVVKLRGGGLVRNIRVNAITGRVLGP
jgi:Flp pilus assembly protein TadD